MQKKVKLPDKPFSKGNLTHLCPSILGHHFYFRIIPYYQEEIRGETLIAKMIDDKITVRNDHILRVPNPFTRGDFEK